MTDRQFLFLQGPPGPLFRLLGDRMAAQGVGVHRINLSGGDCYDWNDGAENYRGSFADWPGWLDRFIVDRGITDLMLFGDCRPYHVSAHRIASSRDVDIHVLEEGYIRPHWMTLERSGVNGNSTLPADPEWFLATARGLPDLPVRPVTASFGRRVHDSYWHYHHVFTRRFAYPHYRTHRPGSLLIDSLGWLRRLARRNAWEKDAQTAVASLQGRPFFLLPLQLSADYQIRAHSAFADMASACDYVIESFARNAPSATQLLIKVHPLDSSFYPWRRHIARQALRHNAAERVHFIDGGDLNALAVAALGMVCVNSTSATLSLAAGKPVCALGDAIYKLPGLTHQGHPDAFWRNPIAPDPALYKAFQRVLLDRCLVSGGLASESAVATLIDSIMARLFPAPTPSASSEDSHVSTLAK